MEDHKATLKSVDVEGELLPAIPVAVYMADGTGQLDVEQVYISDGIFCIDVEKQERA